MRKDGASESADTTFLDIETAAQLAGFSSRHFRRIIEEDGIPVIRIRGKFFIVSRDFNRWKTLRNEKRSRSAVN